MQNKGLFEGVKVLAVARQIAGPFATYHLALHGADVLSVENPKEPDSMRFAGDSDNQLIRKGMSTSFLAQGANKRNMTLNIASSQGQEIFRRLAADSDVVVENLVAGGMAKYGLGYAHLQPLNPKLVYCSITGYGQTGPNARRAAIDTAVQAASGLMSLTGTPESGPMKAGFLMADYATGYAAALAIVSALFHCQRTGEGQYIDAAMLDTAMTLASADFCHAATTGEVRALRGNGDGRYISTIFRCKQGMLAIAATTEPRRQKLWKAIQRTDIPQDPRFFTVDKARANLAELNAEVQKTLMSKTAIEWEDVISAAGVAAMAVRNLTEAMDNPQIVHRGLMHRFEHDPELGYTVVVPKSSYQFSKTPARIHSPPSRIGQHTEAVLISLGYTADQIAGLRDAGVI